jgi:hypothetical protein
MDRDALIAHYEQGPGEVRAALAGITETELDRRPAPDAWTAREIVHHLADSETQSYLRLRKLLAEQYPVVQGYDEAGWARVLHYERPIEPSLVVLDAVRAASAQLLHVTTDWDRAGWHTESGAYTLDDWLSIYAAHAPDHADQIRRARAGQP